MTIEELINMLKTAADKYGKDAIVKITNDGGDIYSSTGIGIIDGDMPEEDIAEYEAAPLRDFIEL